MKNIGIDIVAVNRFKEFVKNKESRFLLNNFSKNELTYCSSFKDAATHLAGTFAAKEAVYKALGKKRLLMSNIEIKRDKTGRPTAWLKNKRLSQVLLSISHTDKLAVAMAIKI